MNNSPDESMTTRELIDNIYYAKKNYHIVSNTGSIELFVKTYESIDGQEERWRVLPECKWHLLAIVYPEKIIMRPVYLSPFAQRYLTPKNGGFAAVVYVDEHGCALPDSVEAAVAQIESRLPKNIFDSMAHGLGLNKDLAPLWKAFSRLKEYTALVIAPDLPMQVEGHRVFIDSKKVDALRRAFNRVTRQTRDYLHRQKQGVVYDEVLVKIQPERFKPAPTVYFELVEGRCESVRKTTLREQTERCRNVRVVREQLKQLVAEVPYELMRLHADIERVTLAKMIEVFKEKVAANLKEHYWQTFSEQKTFILSMVFSRPVELIYTQFHAKGSTLGGAGARIGDFLFKEHGQSIAIIEIKKPTTPLMQDSAYRGQEVFGPTSELSGAITQVLFQQSELRQHWLFHTHKNPTLRLSDADVVKCIIIAGLMPAEPNKLRSFEIFRNAYKDVEVVTFDELLAKLELLEKQLTAPDSVPF